MELHDNPFSPFSFKVRGVLYEKGVDFEKHEVRRHAERDALLALNPRGEVPALVDGDTVLCDSKVISAYLEEKFLAPPVMPKDPVKRARCRYLELKSDTDIDAILIVLGTMKLFRPELQEKHPGALARAEDVLARHYAFLERELAHGGDWFLGTFSLADIAFAPHVVSAAFMGYAPGPEHPALAAWMARAGQRPSLERAIAEMAEGYAASQSDPDPIFDPHRLHWRNDRIECLVRCGLGRWLLDEMDADRAFLSPIP